MLLILVCVSFIALDVVYMAVNINYCVQCFLLIFYIERIQEKVREKVIDLMQAMKVSRLTKRSAVALCYPRSGLNGLAIPGKHGFTQ